MAILGAMLPMVLGGLGMAAAGKLLGGGSKQQAQPAALPQPTRDDAEAEAARMDRLRRRRGAAADMIVNGSAGAEAPVSAPRLVVGS